MEKQAVISALAALAQETRLDLFRLLVKAGPEGLSAGAISGELEIPSATLSFHLKELKSAGLILCEKSGRSRIYSPDFELMSGFLAYLSEKCCSGVGEGSEASGSPGSGCCDPVR